MSSSDENEGVTGQELHDATYSLMQHLTKQHNEWMKTRKTKTFLAERLAAYCAYKIFTKVFDIRKVTDDEEYIDTIDGFIEKAAENVLTGPISELSKKTEKVGLA